MSAQTGKFWKEFPEYLSLLLNSISSHKEEKKKREMIVTRVWLYFGLDTAMERQKIDWHLLPSSVLLILQDHEVVLNNVSKKSEVTHGSEGTMFQLFVEWYLWSWKLCTEAKESWPSARLIRLNILLRRHNVFLVSECIWVNNWVVLPYARQRKRCLHLILMNEGPKYGWTRGVSWDPSTYIQKNTRWIQ